jgi:hypothetical protein
VLLVDHHQAKVASRREERGSRADDHTRVATAHAVPLVVPLAGGKPAVQHGHRVPEPRAEAAHRLWGQAYLRHENGRRTAPRDDLLDRAQVHLRLPGPRHAVHQHPLSGCRFHNGRERLRLTRGQPLVSYGRPRGDVRPSQPAPAFDLNGTGRLEPPQRGVDAAELRRQLGYAHRALGQGVEQ